MTSTGNRFFVVSCIVICSTLLITNRVKAQKSSFLSPSGIARLKLADKSETQSGSQANPRIRMCELNAPLTLKCDRAGHSNVGGRICTAQRFSSHSESLAARFQQPSDLGTVQEPSRHSITATKKLSTDQYCAQLVGLLATTLTGSKANPVGQQRAIEAAFAMVAERASADSDSKIAKLKFEHQRMIAMMSEHFEQTLVEQEPELHIASRENSNRLPQARSEMEPIYAIQYRNSKKLEALTGSNRRLFRSVRMLENELACFTLQQKAKLSQTEIKQVVQAAHEKEAQAIEVENLQLALAELDQRIQELKSQPLRLSEPAKLEAIELDRYLKPVFVPERPLRPVHR